MSKGKAVHQIDLTCKPIYEFKDIMNYLQNPPPWRSLCVDLKPHSKFAIKNIDINNNAQIKTNEVENSQEFCHIDPDAENVLQRHEIKNLPKTLVCHDMANGYHDDSFIDGTGSYDAYTFYNWSGIDIFCYFSHHFITIPPLGWINVGHAHGAKVIGTLITEWQDGRAFWMDMLSSEDKWKNFASMLVAIAKTMKFDGWLLNVENQVDQPATLLQFVEYLHETLHQELKDPELIWYDSVTVHGLLVWQNGLNHMNKVFFDACDGIFTNYSWSERDVTSSAALAGDRRIDVYVGIDVWGRNFYGGGQFNTRGAVEVVHKHGCSIAIFAFAWTHENIPEQGTNPDLDMYEQFLLRDRAFWWSLWPYLNTRLPSSLPFKTSFCRGQGKKRRYYGEVLGPVPWYNLRHMQYQLNSNHGSHGFLLTQVQDVILLSQTFQADNQTVEYRNALQDLETDNELDAFERAGNSRFDKKLSSKIRSILRMNSDKPKSDGKIEVIKSHGNILKPDKHFECDEETGKHLALVQVPGEQECIEVYFEDSFIGGSCLKINPCDDSSAQNRLIRLFHCDFFIEETLIACVVTKNFLEYKEQFLNIHLIVKTCDGVYMKVTLINTASQKEEKNILYGYPVNGTELFKDLQQYLLLNEPGFYVPTENLYEWNVRYYQVDTYISRCRVMSINCQTELEEGPILLGHFGLTHKIRNQQNVRKL